MEDGDCGEGGSDVDDADDVPVPGVALLGGVLPPGHHPRLLRPPPGPGPSSPP